MFRIDSPILQSFVLLLMCSSTQAQSTDLTRQVVDQTLTSSTAPAATIVVADEFHYVGGQRFILRGHTDVEQYFFVAAGTDGDVSKMYWIQFEEMLPDNEGQYDYQADADVRIGPLDFVPHVRRYDSKPVDDSDRGAAYRFLAMNGFFVPTPAIRARFVHIPDKESRQELMIVYLENPVSDVVLTSEIQERLITRGTISLKIRNSE